MARGPPPTSASGRQHFIEGKGKDIGCEGEAWLWPPEARRCPFLTFSFKEMFLANARWTVFGRIFSLTGVRIPWREDTKDRPSVSEGMLCVGLSPRALVEPTQHSSRDCSFPFFSMVWITNPTMEKERNECPGTLSPSEGNENLRRIETETNKDLEPRFAFISFWILLSSFLSPFAQAQALWTR
jgi:hypothetical protein